MADSNMNKKRPYLPDGGSRHPLLWGKPGGRHGEGGRAHDNVGDAVQYGANVARHGEHKIAYPLVLEESTPE